MSFRLGRSYCIGSSWYFSGLYAFSWTLSRLLFKVLSVGQQHWHFELVTDLIQVRSGPGFCTSCTFLHPTSTSGPWTTFWEVRFLSRMSHLLCLNSIRFLKVFLCLHLKKEWTIRISKCSHSEKKKAILECDSLKILYFFREETKFFLHEWQVLFRKKN